MVSVRYVISPLLAGAQRLVHRDKHLTLVYAAPVASAAASADAMDRYLTKAESRYVRDLIKAEAPPWSEALVRLDQEFITCACSAPDSLLYKHIDRPPCPIHEVEKWSDPFWSASKAAAVACLIALPDVSNYVQNLLGN